jgi:hypothetical protein
MFIEDVGFTDDASHFVCVSPSVSVIIHAIRRTQPVEAGTQIEKDAHLPGRAWLSANDTPNDTPRITVEWKPAISLRFLVKDVERPS